jgi:hypothetical protein
MRAGWILLPVCVALGCEGASADNGLTARLRLTGAQFVPGALQPAPDATGPVAMASPSVAKLYPGVQNIPLGGSVAGGTSVLLGFANDTGYWIVPAPLLDVTSTPDNPVYTFSTRMALSPDTPMGMETLIVRGVDAAGNVGPSQQGNIMVAAPVPPGAMVITLEWDTNADLDLHAVVPLDTTVTLPPGVDPPASGTIEVWAKSPLALPPNPRGYDTMDPAVKGVGHLDFDSNSNCQIDGRRQENIVFASHPPAGEYIVRVDAFSMCGQASAQWTVSVSGNDDTLTLPNPATWQATDTDTRGAHGLGAGRLALDFHL